MDGLLETIDKGIVILRFHNIDLHVAVIEDITKLFQELGHEVTSHNMSGHNWVFGRSGKDNFGPLSKENHAGISADDFYSYAKDLLCDYDGFISTYPPAYSMMYEKFEKPIIIQAPIRYEYPFHNNADKWYELNQFLVRIYEKGLGLYAANSLYDKEYFSYFTGLPCWWIPSMCDYAGVSYNPQKSTALIMSCAIPIVTSLCEAAGGDVRHVRNVYGQYNWNDLVQHRAFVHIPYNCSIMSFFEHYSWAVPIFSPSINFMWELQSKYDIVSQLTWNGLCDTSERSIIGCDTSKRFISTDMTDQPDPNDYKSEESFRFWAPRFDCYQLPHITYFDSFDDLRHKLETAKCNEISEKMKFHNNDRKRHILTSWVQLLSGVNGKMF